MGAGFSVDPTITPMMDGDRSILSLNIDQATLHEVVRDTELVDDVLEGNMRGPSTQDCEKSYARTGLESVNLRANRATPDRRSPIVDRPIAFIPLAQLRTARSFPSATEPALAAH